ncbi:MAG: LPP20 family lipoprotein [Proteobacteria bacterium]|nr:LPP20 family lipoprotein [Pseudomonadota bacterium]
MKILKQALFISLALLLAAGSSLAQQEAPAGDEYVQQAESGAVNWGSYTVTATGVGAPPANAVNAAQARGMAKRAATVIARRNLLELIKGVQIDSSTTVENFMVSSDVVVSQIRGFLQNSQILDTAYMSDGSVEVSVGLKLGGSIADVVLPKADRFKLQAPAAMPKPVQQVPGAYSGLVVDARGLGVRPAMSPRILDEAGNELYGTAMVSREYAIQQGMAGYAKDPDKAAANPRVASNPMTVAAIGVLGASRSDLVIPTAKADEIRAQTESKDYLAQARVMILLD